MIEWIPYDKNKPPKEREYLITNGHEIGLGSYWQKKWYPDDSSPVCDSDCTHYAHLNLPQAIRATEPHSNVVAEAEGELN